MARNFAKNGFISNFWVVKFLSIILTSVELSVLKVFILPKNIYGKTNFIKILKGRHFILGGRINLDFCSIFGYLGIICAK